METGWIVEEASTSRAVRLLPVRRGSSSGPRKQLPQTNLALSVTEKAYGRQTATDERRSEEGNSRTRDTADADEYGGEDDALTDSGEESDSDDSDDDEEEEVVTTSTTTKRYSRDGNDYDDDESDNSGGIPVEELFGMYPLPSGQLWVWIADSKLVYEAPLPAVPAEPDQHHSWWHIRKVNQLHLVFIPHNNNSGDDNINNSNEANNRVQRQEETRQLTLLRQALKDHDWYFCDTTAQPSSPLAAVHDHAVRRSIVPDMTWNLQRCFLKQQQQNHQEDSSSLSSSSSCWWHSDSYPDRRFFWNEGVLEPLLQQVEDDDDNDSDAPALQEKDTAAPPQSVAARTLLEWAVPVTSAFVGVQRNLTTQDDDAAGESITYDQLLISRRSQWRAGTRFTKRGADATGNVANYAETEQVVIVLLDHDDNDDGDEKDTTTCRQVLSHVQTRGSIPLRWSSPTDIKTYRPRVRIGTDPLAQARAMRQHLVDQTTRYIVDVDDNDNQQWERRRYPGLVLVNLVDKKSDQGRLGRAMDSVLQAVLDVYEHSSSSNDAAAVAADQVVLSENDESSGEQKEEQEQPVVKDGNDDDDKNNDLASAAQRHLNSKMIHHEWFDFHAEVKGGRWDRLQSLLGKLKPTLNEQGYFHACWASAGVDNDAEKYNNDKKSPWNIQRIQTGVVRTNCMDCLDRTNVLQSIFGRSLLFDQLQLVAANTTKKGDVNDEEAVMALPWSHGEVAHRLLWADNADAISRLYAGTPALKGDFTRTGKRTKKGALDDGMNSLQRYYLNNFLDADRQEGMDLLTRHQDFTRLQPDDDDGEEMTGDNKDDSFRGLTIQEAARKLLMGGSFSSLYGDSSNSMNNKDDESDHVRAKIKNGGSLFKNGQKYLNLMWLPGDLQAQMRSLAHQSQDQQQSDPQGQQQHHQAPTTRPALWGMDQRSARDVPWWVVLDDSSASSDHDNNENGDGGVGGGSAKSSAGPLETAAMQGDGSNDNEEDALVDDSLNSRLLVDSVTAAANQAGFVVAALVASAKAPLATAAMVLGISSFSSSSSLTPPWWNSTRARREQED